MCVFDRRMAAKEQIYIYLTRNVHVVVVVYSIDHYNLFSDKFSVLRKAQQYNKIYNIYLGKKFVYIISD